MNFRSLIFLGLAAALGLSAPSLAVAQTTATNSAAAVQPTKPKAPKPAAKSTQKTGTTARAKPKKPAVKETQQAQARPVGILAALFGQNEKATQVVAARPQQKAVARVAAMPQQPVALTPQGNVGELRSEQSMP